MSRENSETLKVFNQTAEIFLNGLAMHNQIDPRRAARKRAKLHGDIREAFSVFEPGAKILEIGAADGANSKFLESLGYDVTASDVVDSFLNIMQSRGLKTVKFNVLEDDLGQKFDGVFCWRVFVHFTREDVEIALKKIYNHLNAHGRLMFNVINREAHDADAEWKDFVGEYHIGAERYYSYFRESEIREIAQRVGFKVAHFENEKTTNNDWLIFVLEK